MPNNRYLFTCEHAGNQIPTKFKEHFRNKKTLLRSHKAFDAFAYSTAKAMSTALKTPLIATHISRLVIDFNRPLGDATLFKTTSKNYSSSQIALARSLHEAHWNKVKDQWNAMIKKTPVCHIAFHSFTAILRGELRKTDIGILFDPSWPAELEFAKVLRTTLRTEFPRARIDFNIPYRGVDPGLPSSLRKILPKKVYIGFELEFNQSWLKRRLSKKIDFERKLSKALKSALDAKSISPTRKK